MSEPTDLDEGPSTHHLDEGPSTRPDRPGGNPDKRPLQTIEEDFDLEQPQFGPGPPDGYNSNALMQVGKCFAYGWIHNISPR